MTNKCVINGLTVKGDACNGTWLKDVGVLTGEGGGGGGGGKGELEEEMTWTMLGEFCSVSRLDELKIIVLQVYKVLSCICK